MTKIRPGELAERLDAPGDDEPFLLDIRPAGAYRRNAIRGSENLPVYDALRRGDEDALRDRRSAFSTDREVVAICKMGVVAKRATSLLTDEGYDATTLRGGMSGWTGYQNGSLSHRLRSLVWRLR